MKTKLIILGLLLVTQSTWSQRATSNLYVDTVRIMTAGVNRAFIFAKRDTIYAKLYPDSLVLQNVIGDTTWMRELIPLSTSGQNAWFKRNALAPHSGWLSPATATDSLGVPYLGVNGSKADVRFYMNGGTLGNGAFGLWVEDTLGNFAGTQQGHVLRVVSNGTGAGRQIGTTIQLLAGYTGSWGTAALNVANATLGTSSAIFNTNFWGNVGARTASNIPAGISDHQPGTYIGTYATSAGGALNFAVLGNSGGGSIDSTINVGIGGFAYDETSVDPTTTKIGGYFGLVNSFSPWVFHSSALVANVGGYQLPIFLAEKSYGASATSTPIFGITWRARAFLRKPDTLNAVDTSYPDSLEHILAISGSEDSLGINIVNHALNLDRTSKSQASDTASITLRLTANGAPSLSAKNRDGTQIWGADSSGKITAASDVIVGGIAKLDTITNPSSGNVVVKDTVSVDGNISANGVLGTELCPALAEGNWTVGAGWESPIVGPGLIKNINGTGTQTPSGATAIVAGTTYAVTFTVASFTAGTFQIRVGASQGLTHSSTVGAGTYTDYITARTTDNFAIYPSNTSRFTITALSVKALTAGTGDVTSDGTLTARRKMLIPDGSLTSAGLGFVGQPNMGLSRSQDGNFGIYNFDATYLQFNFGTSAGTVGFIYVDGGSSMQVGSNVNVPMHLMTNNSARWTIQAAGHLVGFTDNTYDIGASGATRPRTGYFGTSVIAPVGTFATSVATPVIAPTTKLLTVQGKFVTDSSAYGCSFIDEDIGYDSIMVADAAVWYTIGAVQPPSGYKLTAGDTLKNVTAEDSSLTVLVNGVYEVSYGGNGRTSGMAAASNIHTHVFVNDVLKVHTGSDGNVSASNAYFSLGIPPVRLVLKANDIIKVKVQSPDNASGTIIFHHWNFGVTRIQQ